MFKFSSDFNKKKTKKTTQDYNKFCSKWFDHLYSTSLHLITDDKLRQSKLSTDQLILIFD